MTGKEIFKVLVSCLLVCCFLIGNAAYTYASSSDTSTNSESYENKTELSEKEILPSDEGAKSVDEGIQSSEESETPSSEDNENEGFKDEDIPSSEKTGLNSTETPQKVSSQDTKTEDTKIEDIKTEDTKTEVSYNIVNSESTNIENSEYTNIEYNNYIKKEPENTGLSTAASSSTESSKNPQKSSHKLPPSASVSLHGEKTEVISGEDILLKLSAVNLITRPPMHVQVIIIPPSGMMVSSSEFVQSGAGQYTTTYELEPGQGRDIEVRIESGQVGEFNVEGRVVYYFGDDIKNAEDYTLKLPIKVKSKLNTVDTVYNQMPGFSLACLSFVFVLLTVLLLRRR